MSKQFDELNDAFNVTSEVMPVENQEAKIEKPALSAEDIKKDYEYTRGNLYSIIEKGQETEQPRAYEVAGQLIKSVSDATDKLMELQKKLKDVEESTPKGPTNVTNALFVGSTADLQKMLKKVKEEPK